MHQLPTNITSWYGIFDYANTITNEYLGLLILMAFFVVIFISLKIYTTERAFVTASFLTMLIAILFRVMNFVSNKIVFLFVILTAIALVAVYLATDRTV